MPSLWKPPLKSPMYALIVISTLYQEWYIPSIQVLINDTPLSWDGRQLITPESSTTGEMSGWLEELSDGCWLKDGAELADNCWLKDGPEVADGCWLKAGAEH